MPPPRAIGHLDADCFYVSAERVRAPFLIGKPVAVLGNQGACVIAKSYEMRAAGVKTGMPIWDAAKLCPAGVYVKRDFRWYEVLSRRVLEITREFSPRVEYYSIDEFFFEVIPQDGFSLQETAERMRNRILETVGVPVTVGIARTRTLAKLAAESAKPFGALALTDRDAEWSLLDRNPVTEISGIASRRAARLRPFGIHTCLDLVFADRLRVRELLTRVGEGIWYELHGESVFPLQTFRPPHKVLSRGGSLGGATADPARVYAWLVRNVERLVEELEYHVVSAGALSVHITHKNGAERCAGVELSSPTDRFDLLLGGARACFQSAWLPPLAASYMHVNAWRLRRPGCIQPDLFEPPGDNARVVAAAKREVNARVGRFALRSGATLPLKDVYQDESQQYDICDIRGKHCF
jgi:nucleotidyltransferase/DNA polymerase involved in DNA repair